MTHVCQCVRGKCEIFIVCNSRNGDTEMLVAVVADALFVQFEVSPLSFFETHKLTGHTDAVPILLLLYRSKS